MALLEWLEQTESGATLGRSHTTVTTVQLGDERCELRGGSTRAGVRAYLARVMERRGDFSVVQSTKGVFHRVSLGDSLERIPGFYLYTSIVHDRAEVIASIDGGPFDMIDLHLKLNQALAHLHATGHQRLRAYPAPADLGLRFNVLLAEDMAHEDEAWHARAVWRWDGGNQIGDLMIRPSTPISAIARAMIADAENTGIGTDWAYAGWYAEVVAAAGALRSVPRLEGGWRLVAGIPLKPPPPPRWGGAGLNDIRSRTEAAVPPRPAATGGSALAVDLVAKALHPLVAAFDERGECIGLFAVVTGTVYSRAAHDGWSRIAVVDSRLARATLVAVESRFIELFDHMRYAGGRPSQAQALQMRA